LVNEFVNGLLKREDRETTRKIPIGIIPAGSQNALAVSTTTSDRPELHALYIIRELQITDSKL